MTKSSAAVRSEHEWTETHSHASRNGPCARATDNRHVRPLCLRPLSRAASANFPFPPWPTTNPPVPEQCDRSPFPPAYRSRQEEGLRESPAAATHGEAHHSRPRPLARLYFPTRSGVGFCALVALQPLHVCTSPVPSHVVVDSSPPYPVPTAVPVSAPPSRDAVSRKHPRQRDDVLVYALSTLYEFHF